MQQEGKDVIDFVSSHQADQNYLWSPHWPLLYLDNHVIGVYKPAGLTVQGASPSDISLLRIVRLWIKMRFQKPGNVYVGLVHRLDNPVAGACIFAKTSKAAARLSVQFRERQISKEYIAVVEGIPQERSGRLRHYLIWNRKLKKAQVVPKNEGKEAILEYTVIDVYRGRSLLKITPLTGRRHQIRIQLASHGLPIAGDRLYGSLSEFPGGAIALCARKISFYHPTRKEPVTVVSPEPGGWPWPERLALAKLSDYSVPWLWEDLLRYIPGEESLTKALRRAFPS